MSTRPTLAPEKLRPKTSSSGGSNAFGLVVLVMESLEGSMSLMVVPTEALAWMLYGRWVRHRSDATRQGPAGRAEAWEREESSRIDRCCSIVEVLGGRRARRKGVVESLALRRNLLYSKPTLTARRNTTQLPDTEGQSACFGCYGEARREGVLVYRVQGRHEARWADTRGYRRLSTVDSLVRPWTAVRTC